MYELSRTLRSTTTRVSITSFPSMQFSTARIFAAIATLAAVVNAAPAGSSAEVASRSFHLTCEFC